MTDLIGHRQALTLVQRALGADRLSHAYLITGPRGVGRRTFGLEIAKAVNCAAAPDQRPCGTCRPCRLIDRDVHPDVQIVKRSPDRKVILLKTPSGSPEPSVYHESVGFIQSDAQLRPVEGRRKVYVVLNAEELGTDAANRLLKTLEEPTQYVLFLLTAANRGAVLSTVVSRCQEIRLRPIARAELAQALMERGVTDSKLAYELAALAGGRPGWALAASQGRAALDEHHAAIGDLRDALSGTRIQRMLVARRLSERWSTQPDRVRATLLSWSGWWHDVVQACVGAEGSIVSREGAESRALQSVSNALAPIEAVGALDAIRRAQADLDANVNPRLVLDLLLLKLPAVPTSDRLSA